MDITGVLIESSSSSDGYAIDGSINAVQKLKDLNIPVRFVTNESTKTRKDLVDKLHRLGYSMDVEHVFTPVMALNSIIEKHDLNPYFLIHPDISNDVKCLEKRKNTAGDSVNYNCVVIGDAEHEFNHESLNKAFRILMKNKETRLISLGKGKYYQSDGKLTLDVGAYTAALEYASSKTSEIAGKPESSFFLTAIEDMNLTLENNDDGIIVMVGDDVVSDVGGSQRAGLSGVLVRTGKFRPQDENHPEVKPTYVVDNLFAFVDQIN